MHLPAVLALVALSFDASAEDAPAPPPATEPTAPAEPTPVPPADVPSTADFQALQAQVQALSATVDAQREELARQKLMLVPQKDLEFDLDGYYRTRAYVFGGLFDSQQADGSPAGKYMQQRLRLQPKITYKNLAKFYFQVDALDDVIFGDNASIASTAVFAEQPTTALITGQPGPSIQVSRAWMDVTTPLGSIRAGRMTSHWGLGLLANGGDGFDDLFGENHGGATFDRIMVATRPIAIAQAVTGKPDSNIPFYLAFAVDRVVEDPLFEYYGYECERNLTVDDPDFDERCDTDGDGVTDVEHPLVDETRLPSDRRDDWWLDSDDDVRQMVYVAVYRGEDVDYLGATGDLTAGAYVVNRTQRETDSQIWIADAYVNAKNRGFHLEFEGLTIRGKTRAIALPGAYDPTGQTDDPLFKTADIWSYVARFGYERKNWSATLETGYASGDNNIADEKFSSRAIHRDYNVGILLYEEVLARVTARGWSSGAAGLWSNGGVYNSHYAYPHFVYEPLDNWKLIGAFLVATPDKPDGAIIRCREGDSVDCASYEASKQLLGTEIDIGLKHTWHKHVNFSLEAAFAHATDRLPLVAAGLNPDGKFYTVQSRLAYEF